MTGPGAGPAALVADAALAARVDRAEARLSRDVAQAFAATGDTQVLVTPLAGGLAVYARPESPMNKIIGYGFDGLVDDGALAAVEAAWRARGEPVRFELSTLVDPEVFTALMARGYHLVGFEHVLGLPLAGLAVAAPAEALVVAQARPAEHDAWRAIAVEGALHEDGTGAVADAHSRAVVEDAYADFVRTAGFELYLARIAGELAGVATLRRDDRLAQLCGAATLPALRRRGAQGAMLAARLRDAAAAGCDLAVVTTAPGSRSQANAQRQGFSLLYARALLVQA